MTIKVGDRVKHAGIARTEWMPIRPEGYTGTVLKIFKNGKVAVDFDSGDHQWLRKSYRHGVLHCDPANLTATN